MKTKMIFVYGMVVFCVLWGQRIQAQCNHPDDYTALRALYLSTDGDGWTNNTNWPNAAWFNANPNPSPVPSMAGWYGVTCTGPNVTCLDLDGNPNCQGFCSSGNNLNGIIPFQIGDLSSLTNLHLGSNAGLTGSIPSSIADLTSLTYLSINCTGISGSIPNELTNLTSLDVFWLHHNPNLTGPIPPDIGNMLELNEIAFNDCNLTGEIPASLGNLGGTPFYFLYLQNNNLSGCIPSSLQSLCPNVTTFGNISGNPLIATQSWTNFCNNQEGMCQACGTHPDYAPLMALYNSTGGPNWTNNTGWVDGAAGTNCDPCNGWHGVTCDSARVSTVHLSNNNLKGVLPIDFEELTKLKSLVLDNNIISGTIPLNLGQLSNLENLALYDLNLHGEIPATFLNLQKLKYLSLNGNQLSGEIPDYLGSLSNLENIYLFNNLFKGSIPSSLGDLTKVKNLWLQNNNLNGCLPENLSNLCPIANLVFLENNPLLLTQSWTNFCNNQEGMCEPTNVKEEQSSIPFSLFPNPAYDMIYISQSDKISQLEVMSINGNLILRNHS